MEIFSQERENHFYSIPKKNMIYAFICIFFAVFVVGLLHLYVWRVLRRRQQEHPPLHRGLVQTSTQDPLKTGLDPSVIATLPMFVYKLSEQGEELDSVECTICLSLLEEGETARKLPNCNHTFHLECIDLWLNSKTTCPVCRTEAEPITSPESVTLSLPSPASCPAESAPDSDTNNSAIQPASKIEGSSSQVPSSRLGSFRRMVSWERSGRRSSQNSGPRDDESPV